MAVSAAMYLILDIYLTLSKTPGSIEPPYSRSSYTASVNPFIGTGGYPWVSGHNFPGAARPFSMVRLSPDTASVFLNQQGLNTSGYHYWDKSIVGFSHNRLSGTGATDGGQFRIVPGYGEQARLDYRAGEHLPFSHDREVAFPGYYSVALPALGIGVELTATQRSGIHRYRFSRSEHKAHLLIDISSAIGDNPTRDARVTVYPDTSTVEGQVTSYGSFARRSGGLTLYFSAQFEQPFSRYGIWQTNQFTVGQRQGQSDALGVDLEFDASSIVVKLAISHVSIVNARENLKQESLHKTFDTVVAEAQQQWSDTLSLIPLEGGSDQQRQIFYTALYRSFLMPTVFNDVDGEYRGFDKAVHRAVDFNYYTDLSLWDTFRTLHPLYTLIAPQQQRDMLYSLQAMLQQGGALPRWPSGAGYTGSMLGSPADMVIAEAYIKGLPGLQPGQGFDIENIYQSMVSTALTPVSGKSTFSGRNNIVQCVELGFCPNDTMQKSVAKSLEYAWADFSIAGLAQALGHSEQSKQFQQRAIGYYRQQWNPKSQYFQPRNSDGKFADFEPLLLTYVDQILDPEARLTKAYVEGTALQWRWMVPWDPQGLIELFDSPEHFVTELNDFFANADPAPGTSSPGSYYWHGNEPDLHAVYLFNHAGRPDLTQYWLRWILENKYNTTAAGLDGNDDGATLSAWYIFSSLGLYPIAGTDRYELGAPLFRKALLPIGKNTLKIIAENYAPHRHYVKQVLLNNKPVEGYSLRHADIAPGGELRFVMSDHPAIQ